MSDVRPGRPKVDQVTRYETEVFSVEEALAFVMGHLDSVNQLRMIKIRPAFTLYDSDMFSVVVEGVVELPAYEPGQTPT